MSDLPQPQFQQSVEAMEGYASGREIPPPVNPLQAQTEFEKRAKLEDWVAHIIAVVMTSGFFLLAFAALLGFVKIESPATATFLGTVMGYAIGKLDPIMTRYFIARSGTPRARAPNGPPATEPKPEEKPS
jgi:hypothetical protein